MENDSTPPPLANVGLHTNRRVTETRNRRLEEPKKRVACSSDEELFVSRPQFKKTNLSDDQKIMQKGEENLVTDDQEMKQEAEENLVTDDQEEPMEPMGPRLVNFMKGSSSIKWLNREFGKLEVDEALNGKPYDMKESSPLPQEPGDPPILQKGLSALNEALLQVLKDPASVEHFPYSNRLLEAIMLVKKLLAMKKNALLEISLRNDEIEANKDSKAWGSSQHRETKELYQRCFATLYCVNDDLVAPMTVLHEHLEQYRREVAEKKAGACTPVEIYRKCLDKARLDIQLAEKYKSLLVRSPDTKDLVLKLQTVLNIMGECGGPNSVDLLSVVDCLFFQLSQSLPPDLSAHLKEKMDELEPCLKRLKDLFKSVPMQGPA